MQHFTRSYSQFFKASDLTIEKATNLRQVPKADSIAFGKNITDHILKVDWTISDGWEKPKIVEYKREPMSTAISAINYGISIFEGMKAYKTGSGQITVFRPLDHFKRFRRSAERLCLPDFSENELLKCLDKLLLLDQHWIPTEPDSSLYIRPVLFATEETLKVKYSDSARMVIMMSPAASYFKSPSTKGVSLLADSRWVRSWPGGHGSYKTGCNYAPSLYAQKYAESKGCEQVLWLYDGYVTEIGTMNLFVVKKSNSGKLKLLTPPADELILNGMTRQSILEITKNWKDIIIEEKGMKLKELLDQNRNGEIIEMFGSGTACVVSPVSRILHNDQWHEIPCNIENGISSKIKSELSKHHKTAIKPEWTHIVKA